MAAELSEPEPPPPGTYERWAWDYVTSVSLREKLRRPPRDALRWERLPPARRLAKPGRPPELTVVPKSARNRPGSLASPRRRAQLLHTFLHHELQAAELMCWALLAFTDAPQPFRRGLIGLCDDEIRHMGMYRRHLRRLGFEIGAFPVRDWFWERVPRCPDAASFVATLGMGFEGGNLDHTRRFAERFRQAGDETGARLQERVGREEEAHVRFAIHWFAHFTGTIDFDAWCARLPPPLSPLFMRGDPLASAARLRAGMTAAFVEQLAAWAC